MPIDIGPKIGVDGEAEYRAQMKLINQELRTLTAEMKSVTSSFKTNASGQEALTQKAKVLEKQLAAEEKRLAEVGAQLEKANAKYGQGSMESLKYEQALHETQAAANKFENELAEVQSALDGTTAGMEDAADAADALSEMLARQFVAEKVSEGASYLFEALKDCTKASMEFESAMTGVEKTVEATPEQLAAIASEIKKLATETGLSTTSIAAVAEAAGQLGIAATDIMAFTQVMVDLGTTTNLSAEEAATSLAKLSNITGMSADEYSRLGSTIVALGNNFATTERDIVEMATRMASAATMAGFTEAELLAVATAVSAVGIEAEAGGTAMTQTLNAITKAVDKGGDKLQTLAKVAGMSASEFATAWESSPMEVLTAFISGLGDLSTAGENVTSVLEELGMSGIRQSNTLRALALANENLAGATIMANEAWMENTALTAEATKRYQTAESQIAKATEAANNLKIAIGDAWAPIVGDAAEGSIEFFGALEEFTSNHPEMVRALTLVAGGFGAVAVGITSAGAASKVLKTVGIEMKALEAIGAASVGTWGTIASLAALMGYSLYEGVKGFDAFVDSLAPATASLAEAELELAKVNAEIEKMESIEPGFWNENMQLEYDAYRIAAAKLTDQINAFKAAETDMGEAALSTLDPLERQSMIYEDMDMQIQTLLSSYQELYTAAYESLSGQFGLFETVAIEITTSTEEMIAALASQAEYMNTYAQNISAAADMGIRQGLIAALADGSVESAAYLAAIIADVEAAGGIQTEAGQAIIQSLNDNYDALQTATAEASGVIASTLDETDQKIADFVASVQASAEGLDISEDLIQYATDSIAAYMAGIDSQSGPLLSKVEALGVSISTALQKGINSVQVSLPSISGLGAITGSFGIPGFATGLDRVPYDNFLARLHKDEMVLTKDAADDYREGKGGNHYSTQNTVNLYAQTIDEPTIEYLYQRFSTRMGAEA